MRKTLSLVLSIVMILSLAIIGVSAEGEATVITTAEEFAAMEKEGNYKLGADLVLTETYATFNGTLDGQGHSLTVSAPVFTAMNGTVKNLTIKGSITVTSGNVAALCLTSGGGVFENVTNEADVSDTLVRDNPATNATARTGGICAYAGSDDVVTTFINCVNKGNITGPEATGGILAESQKSGATLTGCVNYGKISLPLNKGSGDAAGGIVGYSGNKPVTYADCVNYGEIDTIYRAGGITGDSRKGASYTNCFNYGKVTGDNAAGGICGYSGDSSIAVPMVFTNCINFGEISGANNVGGIIGYLYGINATAYVDIEGCINNGKIKAGKFGSQFIGYCNSWNNTIRNSIGAGEMESIEVADFPTIFVICGCSSAPMASMITENVYLADGGKTEWLTWAAFTDADKNAKNRIPLSAVLGQNLDGVEYEYPTFAEAKYNTPSGTVKIVANNDISRVEDGLPVGIRPKAITRITLSEDSVQRFASVSGVECHLENGKVLFGAPTQDPVNPPATGDALVWVAIVAAVSVLGMGIAIKAKQN